MREVTHSRSSPSALQGSERSLHALTAGGSGKIFFNTLDLLIDRRCIFKNLKMLGWIVKLNECLRQQLQPILMYFRD